MRWGKVCVSIFLALVTVGGMPSNGYSWLGTSASLTLDVSGTDTAPRQELFVLTNRTRAAQGLPPLKMDEALMKLAQDHAAAMAKQGFISHDLPSGNVFVRLSRNNYNYETARENVASARTASFAHSALMKSPGHKANILADDVSSIGIGVVREPVYGKYLFIAEVFATPRKNYEPAQVKELLTTEIEKLKQDSPLIVIAKQDPMFEDAADQSLSALSDSYSREDLRKLLAKSAGELQKNGKDNVAKLEVSVQVLKTPEKLSIPDTLRQGLVEMYGAAVRKIKDNRDQPAFLVLTLMGMTR